MSASDGGTCTAALPYECTWSSIPYPGSRTVTLQVRLPTANVWPNSAQVTASTADSNTGNNALSRNITVVAAANLGITATSSAGAGTVAAGTPYNYTLTVNNSGPDPLPAGQASRVTFNVPTGSSITARPTGTGWDCQPSGGSADGARWRDGRRVDYLQSYRRSGNGRQFPRHYRARRCQRHRRRGCHLRRAFQLSGR